jgi:kinesin family protein 2/24
MKADRKLANDNAGRKNDVEYDLLIEQQKQIVGAALNHVSATEMNICICVRKRPLFDKEYNKGEIDCVSSSNPNIIVHEPKIKVDGITKYVQDTNF